MPADQLLVLRAGVPPVRGRKITYWRERAFQARVMPPPSVAPHPGFARVHLSTDAGRPAFASGADDLTLQAILPTLAEAGLELPPPQGASEAEVEAWVDRFIDGALRAPDLEINHV